MRSAASADEKELLLPAPGAASFPPEDEERQRGNAYCVARTSRYSAIT